MIQSIHFNKNVFTKSQSKKWIKLHEYKPIKKMHETENFYNYRLINPIHGKKFFNKYIENGLYFTLIN